MCVKLARLPSAADLPISAVNCCLIFVEGSTDKAVRVRRQSRAEALLWPPLKAHVVSFRPGWFRQVVASLLVSVVLLGFKLSALKRLVQVSQRRTELQAALVLLEPKVEAEKVALWLADVEHDAKQREDRIAAMDSAAGRVLDTLEAELLAKGAEMFAVFEASSGGAKQLEHSPLIMYSETKLDAATGLLLGRAAAMVRATPQEIVVHMLNYDSLYMKSINDPTVVIRSDAVEHVNAHHTIVFNRLKLGAGLSQRTFLNSTVAKKVEDDPPTYLLVGLPIAQHDKITPKDEKNAVRAENCRAFKLTELTAGMTKLEYACSLNLRGSIPQAITNKVSVPEQMHGAPAPSSRAHFCASVAAAYRRHTILAHGAPPVRLPHASIRVRPVCFARTRYLLSTKRVCESMLVRFDAVPAKLQQYFQQILPLAKCDAGDGRVVGQLLVDLTSSDPKDPARAIREFAHRTAMLRDCGFAHIGEMLAKLLSADVQGGPDNDSTAIPSTPVTTAAVGPNRSALTEKQAITIGSAIASCAHQAHALAAGLNKVVKEQVVLHAMRLEYAWFMPMLEAIMVHKTAERRGSVVMNRLRSMRSSIAPVTPIDVASEAEAANEASGFSSVVRLGAHLPILAVRPLASDAL